MTIAKLLLDLSAADRLAPATAGDANLALLEQRLSRGDRVDDATFLADGAGGVNGPLLMMAIAGLTLPIRLSRAAAELLTDRVGKLKVSGAPDSSGATMRDGDADRSLTAELGKRIHESQGMPPRERAVVLMDWIMERIHASRCALIPFESGTPGAPLVFKARGEQPDAIDPRQVPRKVVAAVARTRQPRISHNVAAGGRERAADETAIRQQVRSYMAVPVIFRGDLLAVCYVDRFDEARRFSDDERTSFEAFAYELAWPLLEVRDEQRREEYRLLRDVMLEGGDAPRVETSPALESVLARARKLAPHVSENLLILGETGVGKEVVARYVHEQSGRADGPFVAVNVSSISAELFESELMGSVKGAFTGAVDRPGRITDAHRGTIFLDEIGDLALTNQVKLLRFLQDKQVTPVGGGRGPRVVDVRIIAATNRPIHELVTRGEFREDLLHRFAPPLVVPPLRERREEILPHAEAWLRSRARRAGVPVPRFSEDAVVFLESYPWPGNVRQLEAVVSHAVLLASSQRIGRALLESLVPVRGAAAGGTPDALTTWEAFRSWRDGRERAWLEALLARHDGRVSAAARDIEVPLSTLRSLLQRHDLRT